MTVRVDRTDRLRVFSPMHPQFREWAKNTMNARPERTHEGFCWVFDLRDEEAVRAQLRDVYGDDGTGSVELVDVRVKMSDVNTGGRQVWMWDRCVAERAERDFPVRLGRGVVVVEGDFGGRGGSVKYPAVEAPDDVVIEVRDVPRPLVDADDMDWVRTGTAWIVRESTPAVPEDDGTTFTPSHLEGDDDTQADACMTTAEGVLVGTCREGDTRVVWIDVDDVPSESGLLTEEGNVRIEIRMSGKTLSFD